MRRASRHSCVQGFVVAIAIAMAAGTAAAQSSTVQRRLDDGDEAFARADYASAASHWDRAIAAEPRSIQAAYFAKRADIFLLLEQYAEGVSWIKSTAERNRPGDALILEKKALLLDRAGQSDDAAALADQLVAKDPTIFSLQLLLGDHHFARGAAGAKRADQAFHAFLAHRPESLRAGDSMIQVKLGYVHLRTGGFAAARDELREAIEIAGGNANTIRAARMGLCAAFAGLERWKDTVSACREAIALRDDHALRDNLAVAYLRLGKIALARKTVDAYAKLRPDTARGHVLRGDVEAAAGALDDAGDAYEKAVALTPDDPGLALRIGRLELRRDPPRLPEAAAALRRALAAYPDRVDVIVALADTLQRMERWGEAATLAVEGAARTDLKPAVRAQLLTIAGDALHDEGTDLEGAVQHYTAALAADPASAGARDGAVATYNRIALAQLDRDEGPIARVAAIATLEQALELDGGSAMTRLNLGALLLADGQLAPALVHLEQARTVAPDDARVSWAMARSHAGLGAVGDAERHYREAIASATRAQDATMVAQISTGLAGLLLERGRADDAIKALDGLRDEVVTDETRRIRAVAHLHRGVARMHAGQNSAALDDLDAASTARGRWLEGDDARVWTFARAVVRLRAGAVKEARTSLEALAKQLGNQKATWLAPPYDRLGIQYYIAFSYYRDDSSQAYKKATVLLEKLEKKASGTLRTRVRTLLRASYQMAAYDAFQRGNVREAKKAIGRAKDVKLDDDADPVLIHNVAVLAAGSESESVGSALERIGDEPPEVLVNLGIIASNQGKPVEAHRLWKRAKAKGARAPNLESWMNVIERVFGASVGE